MSDKRTNILNHSEIERKLQRMAWEIYENNHLANELVLIGISDNGETISKAIGKILTEIATIKIKYGRIDLNKSEGLNSEVFLKCDWDLKDNIVIMMDDVLNSGQTMMTAMLPILAQKPKKIQTAVLADRNHKKFPIKADIVGISLATTLQEHIWFAIEENNKMVVFLT